MEIEDNPLVSIIVPVYNSERFLKKNIDTLRAQTYDNIEVLLINDGSTDNSFHVMEEIQEEDPRVLIFNNKNLGLASTRNYGISKATGKYVLFMDSDDFFIKKEAIENSIKKIQKEKADLLIFGFEKYYFEKKSKIIHVDDSLSGMYSGVWNKMYTKELLTNIFFPDGLYYEDMGFTILVTLKAKNKIVIDEAYYAYVQHSGSIASLGGDYRRHLDVVDVLSPVLNSYLYKSSSKNVRKEIKILLSYQTLTHLIVFLGYKNINKDVLSVESQGLIDFIEFISDGGSVKKFV